MVSQRMCRCRVKSKVNESFFTCFWNFISLSVADQANSRVLFIPAGSATATLVYGQRGDYTTCDSNMGGATSAASVGLPFSVTLAASGNLYVSDYVNNRVLAYTANSTVAVRVYGQSSFTDGSNNAGTGAPSASTLYHPVGVAFDVSGHMYVSDYNNHRVLMFP
jgi:hypothetical protein